MMKENPENAETAKKVHIQTYLVRLCGRLNLFGDTDSGFGLRLEKRRTGVGIMQMEQFSLNYFHPEPSDQTLLKTVKW